MEACISVCVGMKEQDYEEKYVERGKWRVYYYSIREIEEHGITTQKALRA